MLTQAQKDTIANAIIAQVHRPNLNTFIGKFAVNALVNQIDALLSHALPPDISTILADVNKGLTPDEIQHLKEVLPSYILSRVHSPLLQAVLAQIISIVVDILLQALTQGHQLHT